MMKNSEAAHVLKNAAFLASERTGIKVQKAVEMAVNALEKTQWIPVSERLPEEKINENTSDFEYVLCTTTFGDVRPYKFGQTIGWSEPHFWHWNSMMDKYVVAWCELPEPYQEV